MVLIGELVKALNLYSNPGVGNHSSVNKNSHARDASKKFWMQKTWPNWVFLTWSLCFIALPFVTIVPWLCFFLSLGFALHNIHAFHSRCFYFYKINNKKKGKGSTFCFCTILFFFLEQGWSIYFHITCFLYLVLLWWAYLLHSTSWRFVVHVVWEKCVWFLITMS